MVGNGACIRKELIQLSPVEGSFERTRPKEDTGSNCPGVCDSRLGDNALSHGSFQADS